jgi:predicted phage tail protein
MKLGSTNVASFRLGAATPSKVYLGSAQAWSDVVASPPGAVGSLAAVTSATQQSAASLSWTAPASDGGSAITGYNVYYSLNGGTTYTFLESAAGSPYEAIIPAAPAAFVYVRVRAVNAAGEAAGDAMADTTTVTLSDGAPSAPLGLTGEQEAGGDISVSWSAPQYSGATDYEVSYQKPASMEQFATTGNALSYNIDLSPMSDLGAEFAIRVRAINSFGNGQWSNYIYVLSADVPPATSMFSASTNGSSPGAVDLSIVVPADNYSPILSYDVQVDDESSFSTPISLTNYTDQPSGAGSSTFYKTISGLTGNATYYFRVRFVNAVGNGEWSSSDDAVASQTPPTQVQTFSVTASGSIGSPDWSFSWNAPSSDGGNMISGYEIQEAGSESFSGAASYYPYSGSTSFTQAIAVADATRYFRIRAVNSVGSGDWSGVQTAYYDTPTVPGAPTITQSFYDAGFDITYVSYNFPADDGGQAITGYTFYFDGSPVTPAVNTLMAGNGEAEFYQDWSGTDATVSATNSVGEGPQSASSPVV